MEQFAIKYLFLIRPLLTASTIFTHIIILRKIIKYYTPEKSLDMYKEKLLFRICVFLLINKTLYYLVNACLHIPQI